VSAFRPILDKNVKEIVRTSTMGQSYVRYLLLLVLVGSLFSDTTARIKGAAPPPANGRFLSSPAKEDEPQNALRGLKKKSSKIQKETKKVVNIPKEVSKEHEDNEESKHNEAKKRSDPILEEEFEDPPRNERESEESPKGKATKKVETPGEEEKEELPHKAKEAEEASKGKLPKKVEVLGKEEKEEPPHKEKETELSANVKLPKKVEASGKEEIKEPIGKQPKKADSEGSKASEVGGSEGKLPKEEKRPKRQHEDNGEEAPKEGPIDKPGSKGKSKGGKEHFPDDEIEALNDGGTESYVAVGEEQSDGTTDTDTDAEGKSSEGKCVIIG
jgi:hypothetical protein